MTNRVSIFTGSSPQDIPAALKSWKGRAPKTVDLAFIDGMHTDEAAAADFAGLLPYLRDRSVLLWHNVHGTRRAFEEAVAADGGRYWNQRRVLRTYGPLGIYYHDGRHPLLHEYLVAMNLLWNDWELYVSALKQAGRNRVPESTGVVLRTTRRLLSRIRRL
jgi:hypothetical protein